MQVILRILYMSPEVHTGSLFSTSLSALHNNNKSPLLCECKDFIELLLVQGPYKTASLLSSLYGTRICLETDANSIAKEILKKVQEEGRVSYLTSQHWGSRDPCATITFHTLVGESCPQPSWIQALLLYLGFYSATWQQSPSHINCASTAQGKGDLDPKDLQILQLLKQRTLLSWAGCSDQLWGFAFGQYCCKEMKSCLHPHREPIAKESSKPNTDHLGSVRPWVQGSLLAAWDSGGSWAASHPTLMGCKTYLCREISNLLPWDKYIWQPMV